MGHPFITYVKFSINLTSQPTYAYQAVAGPPTKFWKCRAKKILDAFVNDTKANFPGKHRWQSTISEKVGRGGGAWVKNSFFSKNVSYVLKG